MTGEKNKRIYDKNICYAWLQGTKRSQKNSGDEDTKPSKKSKKNVEDDTAESSDTETQDLDLSKDSVKRGDKWVLCLNYSSF
jgi:hypothetical protein